MNIFQAVLLGIVEGLTEFLPISSTFHLIFASKLFGVTQNDFLQLFEVFIQGGAIIAVLFLYGRELLKNRDLMKKIAVSFVPTAVIGLALYKVIKTIFFHSNNLMIGVFVAMGVVFLAMEWLIKRDKLKLDKTVKNLTYTEAFLIGVIQSLAVIPGVSRAGAVMVGFMFMKFRRDEAAKYSFMLAVPTILAASGYDLFKMRSVLSGNANNFVLLAVGTVAAFVSAYFVIRWFIDFLKKRTLTIFAFYRFIIAIILVAFGL